MSKVYRQESSGSLSVPTLLTSFPGGTAPTTPRHQMADPPPVVSSALPTDSLIVRADSSLDGTYSLGGAIDERVDTAPSELPSSELDQLRGTTVRVDRPPLGLVSIPQLDESLTYRVVKRLIDILGSATGLMLLAPLMGLCAILIKFQDGGPVFFRQVRVGKRGERFEIVKFRSMVVNAEQMQSELADLNEHDDHRTFKILNDPRITRVGRFMRRMSLDELPQLWNVLCGDMTLVGPRPALPREVAMYDPEHMVRLAVRPGLTCIWQVSGRSNLGFQRQIELDLDYIRRRNIFLDLKLIIRTLPAVVLGEGAA